MLLYTVVQALAKRLALLLGTRIRRTLKRPVGVGLDKHEHPGCAPAPRIQHIRATAPRRLVPLNVSYRTVAWPGVA